MAGRNSRNAGRKPGLSDEQIKKALKSHESGESISKLAQVYGVSRQTMSAYMNHFGQKETMEQIYRTYKKWAILNHEFSERYRLEEYSLRMEYMCEDELCTVILVNFSKKQIAVLNCTDEVIHQAFGVKAKPTWEDFEYFLESRCFPKGRDFLKQILRDLGLDSYDPLAIIEKTKGRMAEDKQWIHLCYYRPNEGAMG